MVARHTEFEAHNPLRSVDWRWLRACSLIQAGRNFSPQRDEPLVGRLIAYLRRCHRVARRKHILRCLPDLYLASEIRDRMDTTKTELEARLLNRQPFPYIAARMCLDSDVVAAYEGAFFNVLDRIDATDWVLRHAIGCAPSPHTAELALARAVKLVAYQGNVPTLEAVLPFLHAGPESLRAPSDLTTSEGRRCEAIKLSLALEMLPDDGETQQILVKSAAMLDIQGWNSAPQWHSGAVRSLLEDVFRSAAVESEATRSPGSPTAKVESTDTSQSARVA